MAPGYEDALITPGRIAIVAALATSAGAQQLQHHPPDQLTPLSCRDQMHRNRDIFRRAAKVEVSKVTRRDLLSLVVDLDSPSIVAHICANGKLKGFVNVLAADADYRMVIK